MRGTVTLEIYQGGSDHERANCVGTLRGECGAAQGVLAVEKLESHGCVVPWATGGDL